MQNTIGKNEVLEKYSHIGQIGLILALVLMMGMMFLPIPSWGIDFMLAISIMGTLTILILSISVS